MHVLRITILSPAEQEQGVQVWHWLTVALLKEFSRYAIPSQRLLGCQAIEGFIQFMQGWSIKEFTHRWHLRESIKSCGGDRNLA